MRFVTTSERVTDGIRGALIVLENFDGVHLGQQAVLKRAQAFAKQFNAPVDVLTFDPHPRDFSGTRQASSQITSLDQKIEKLALSGVDYLFLQRFDSAFAEMSPGDFVDHVLIRRFGARHIVSGGSYQFGRNREGDVMTLRRLSTPYGVGVTAVPSASLAGRVLSSATIREALRRGEPETAAGQLGAPWKLRGRIAEISRNPCISLGAYVRPAPGTNAVRVTAGGSSCAGIAQVGHSGSMTRHDLMRLRLPKRIWPNRVMRSAPAC